MKISAPEPADARPPLQASVMEMIDGVKWTQPGSGAFIESLLADTRTFFEVFPWNGEEEGLEDDE